MNATIAPAGQRTVLYQIRQGSIPMNFDFTVEPVDAGAPLGGTLEVTASSWIVPGTPQRLPLQSRHQVRRGMWNTFFTLAIIPDTDVRVTPVIGGAGGPGRTFIVVMICLVLLVVAAAVAMMFLTRP